MLKIISQPIKDVIKSDENGDGSGAGSDGLVLRAISHREPVLSPVEVEIYAALVVVKRHDYTNRVQAHGERKPRGKVTDFTRKARRRMLMALAKLRGANRGLFLTLTYPGEFHGDYRRVKRDLDALKKRLQRECPNAGGFWRVELERRKSGASEGCIVPHFHILLFGAGVETYVELVKFRRWLALAWFEVVGSGERDHLEAGTQADEIRSRRHANYYASKYAAKTDDDGAGVEIGNRWGMFGAVDVRAALVTSLTVPQFYALRRLVRRWLKNRNPSYSTRLGRASPLNGFSCFGVGDEGFESIFDSTVFRMVTAL